MRPCKDLKQDLERNLFNATIFFLCDLIGVEKLGSKNRPGVCYLVLKGYTVRAARQEGEMNASVRHTTNETQSVLKYATKQNQIG